MKKSVAVSFLLALGVTSPVAPEEVDLGALYGQAADVASSAYAYRADRPPDGNPPESWIGLVQYANLPFDQRVDPSAPPIAKVLCALFWEEVRPIRRIELVWPAQSGSRPSPEDLLVTCFDGTDGTAHTWWNPRSLREAGRPQASGDAGTYAYSIPVDTWGVVVAVRGEKEAAAFDVPVIRALVPDRWKEMDLEIEWGFDASTAFRRYDGRVEGYDAIIGEVRPLSGDTDTAMTGPRSWRSERKGEGRRGVRMSVLYMGSSRWRRVWPYHSQPEDVARTIVTLWTESGSFSFQVSDLELGPILAPEHGFFVRAVSVRQAVDSGRAQALATLVLPMGDKVAALPGVPKIRGWARTEIPWFGVNPDSEAGVAGNLKIPARAAAMHPGPDLDVAVGWRSPIQGRVRVTGRVAMGDSQGGNGVEWSIVLESRTIRQVLGRGAIGAGGSQMIPDGADAKKLSEVSIEKGDILSLVLSAKGGDHICDTTIVEIKIDEIGGAGRSWDLPSDLVEDIGAGNPHADRLGNADVWRLYAIEAAGRPPAPSEPPFRLESTAENAKEFEKELAARGLRTIRARVREHPEQTWEGAVTSMRPGEALPPHPKPPFEPAMRVDLPCERLASQWNLGAWHILRRSSKGADGKWRFNDYPFGILASETHMILRALDLQGMHREAADGLDQWLELPLEPRVVPGQGGHHEWARPDRPLGHFSDGKGCLTHAEGIPGAGGHMDGVHCMGPGAILLVLVEHFRLTGDLDWLKAHAPRMKAGAEWILRQRKLLTSTIPGGARLWSKGLQPAHVVTPDSMCMHMLFYESEAYYWLAVKNFADALARIDPQDGAALSAEAAAYREDLLAAIGRSIVLTPVVAVRDGTYRSFIPFAPYVRGFASGAWGWRRCQGHVGAIYWDTVQSADPLVSPSGLLSPGDRRAQGHLDVLEDRLLLENTKIRERLPDFNPEKDWFSRASWQYQCGLERHANIHLEADDPPSFIRSMLNQYAVDIMPGEYTFREHTTGGPPDKIYEESCFLERFRGMLVLELDGFLWLARATPRVWLEQGKRILVKSAPTHFGPVSYEIVSDVDRGRITATVQMPSRDRPAAVILRLRHPRAAQIASVTVDGRASSDFDREKEIVLLGNAPGTVNVEVMYR